MKALLAGLLLACWPAVAVADIFAWEDAQGITHYTNLKSEVPKTQAAVAQVVVDESTHPPTVAAPPVGPAPAAEAEVVYDQPPVSVSDAYLAGLERGLALSDPVAGGGGGGIVQISGPLVVNVAPAPVPPYPSPYYDNFFPYGFPFLYGSPLVTTFGGGHCHRDACFGARGGRFGRHHKDGLFPAGRWSHPTPGGRARLVLQ